MFPAFRRDPLLTLGAASRDIDYEAEWKRVLLASQPTRGRREGGLARHGLLMNLMFLSEGSRHMNEKGALLPACRLVPGCGGGGLW